MKTINKILILAAGLVLLVPGLQAQTATPTTTLCAAQSQTATTVCLTSTTNVVNQTGIYVDQEYELVQIGNNSAVCTGPCNVTVSRNNRNAGSGPTYHANASIAWLALTPGKSVIPGVNGFFLGTNMNDIGTCTRTANTYLPHIYVNRGIKRDCNTAGYWVDFAPGSGLDFPSPTPLVALTANQALSVSSGNYVLTTKAGVIALTLAAPTAGVQDGMVIVITAFNGANIDTLTATALLQNGATGSPYTTATFGVTTNIVGASLTLKAIGGFWFVMSSTGVVLT